MMRFAVNEGIVMRRGLNGGALAIASLFALFPLLPSGPRYFGINAANALDAAVVALLIVWLVVRASSRRHMRSGHSASIDSTVLSAWRIFMIVVTGATIVGLAADNRIESEVFRRDAPAFLLRVIRPLDFTIDPFYPARVWLMFLEGFLVFVVVRDCYARATDRFRFLRIVSWGWLTGFGIVSVFALVQYFTRFQLHPRWLRDNPSLVRAYSTLDDPNALGAYLLLGIGLAVGMGLYERRRTPSALAVALAFVGCGALVTSVSRIALAALPATALVLLAAAPIRAEHVPFVPLARLRRYARISLASVMTIVALLLVARLTVVQRQEPLPETPFEAVRQTLDPRVPLDSILKTRLGYWRAAIRMMGDSPITGVGLGRYPRLLPQYWTEWLELENAHNFFLQVLAEMGLLGLAAFATLLGLSIGVLTRAIRQEDPRAAGFSLGVWFGIVAFAMTLLTGHPLVQPSGQILLASVLALGTVNVSESRVTAPILGMSRPVTVVAAVVGAVYVAAAWRTPPPPQQGDVWGYSWGLYPEEGGFFPESWGLIVDKYATGVEAGKKVSRYRWTGAEAVLELKVPDGAADCMVQFAAFLPSHGIPQHARLSYGGRHQDVPIGTSDLNIINIPLTRDVLDRAGRLLINIAVSPAFVPADLGVSDDRRRLGVQLFRPRCGERRRASPPSRARTSAVANMAMNRVFVTR